MPQPQASPEVVKPTESWDPAGCEAELADVRDDLSKLRMEFEDFKEAVRKHMDSGKFETESLPVAVDTGSEPVDPETALQEKVTSITSHGRDGVASKDIAGKGWHYSYGGTVWDVLMFTGMNVFTWSDELIILILGALNMFIQVAFIQLVMKNMTSGVFSDESIVEATQDWRVTMAHNTNYVNTFTGSALSQAVCSEGSKGNLMDGVYQANLIDEVHAYLEPFMGSSAGMWMFLLSVFLWTLECAYEFGQVLLCCSAAWSNTESLHRSGRRTSVMEFWSGKSVLLLDESLVRVFGEVRKPLYHAYFSKARASAITLLIVLPRLVIVGYLWFAGVLFIVGTTDLQEMLLNCVALGVVLHTDEMIYRVLMPDKSRLLVSQAHPVHCRGFSDHVQRVWPYVETFALLGLIMLVSVIWAWPVAGTMKDVDQVMCKGDKDFVAAEIPSGSIITSPVAADPVLDRTTHAYRAVFHRTGLQTDPNGQLHVEGPPWVVRSMQDMQEYAKFTIQEEARFRRVCEDDITATRVPEFYYAQWDVLKELIGNASVASCVDLVPYCYLRSKTGNIARMICPESCGGADPLSGQLYDVADRGMIPECRLKVMAQLAQMPCADFALPALQTHPGWARYAVAINSFLREVYERVSFGNATIVKMLEERTLLGMQYQGCNYFSTPLSVPGIQGIFWDFCDPESGAIYGLRTARMWCPQTCGCSPTDIHDCPLSCR